MQNKRWIAAGALLLLAAACNGGGDGGDVDTQAADEPEAAAPKPETQPAEQNVDLTRLPVGDGKISTTTPAVGVLCTTQPTNGQGAQTMGPWFNGYGTWDATKK